MDREKDGVPIGCRRCLDGAGLDLDFSMAFQPIVDVASRAVFAYEALVRGVNGEGAGSVLGRVSEENRYRFDQRCRVKAIELAAKLKMAARLSINFLPNAIYDPETCLSATLEAAKRFDFPADRIMFEFTEAEAVKDHDHLAGIIQTYKAHGFTTAIDDFGAGYAGLNLLADFQPDVVKIDMEVTRDINGSKPRQSITRAVVGMCKELGLTVIAEGIETPAEVATVREMGVRLFQGYLFAKPAFEALPEVTWENVKA